MAFIILKSSQAKVVSPEVGTAIWLVMNGEINGNKSQQMFCKKVKSVYLNKSNAPKSYVESHQVRVADNVVSQSRLPYID